jgi:hypothetical protein
MANKNPRVQTLCLELIEYLTCTSTLPFYQEIHGREFLQMINFYINQASTNEVAFCFQYQKSLGQGASAWVDPILGDVLRKRFRFVANVRPNVQKSS